jgi:hypothetical protein
VSILAAIPIIGAILDPVGRIGELIARARLQEVSAGTDRERIAAQERTRTLELRRDSLVIDPFAPLVRMGFAMPFVVYNAKLVLWDKVLGFGATDPLGPELVNVQLATIGFYFLHSIFTRR